MRPGRNSNVDLSNPHDWDDQTIADVLAEINSPLWRVLAEAIGQHQHGDLARRTAQQARLCDVTGNGNLWLLFIARTQGQKTLPVLPDRRRDQHWP